MHPIYFHILRARKIILLVPELFLDKMLFYRPIEMSFILFSFIIQLKNLKERGSVDQALIYRVFRNLDLLQHSVTYHSVYRSNGPYRNV